MASGQSQTLCINIESCKNGLDNYRMQLRSSQIRLHIEAPWGGVDDLLSQDEQHEDAPSLPWALTTPVESYQTLSDAKLAKLLSIKVF